MPQKEVLVFLRIKALKVSLKLKGRGGGGAFSYLHKLLYDTPWPFILSLVQCP